MEQEIRGTVEFFDDKIILRYDEGETETWVLAHYPSFPVGFNFVKHRGGIFHKK